MRKALNENPVAQIAVLGVLAVIVGFLLLTKVAHKSESSSSSSTSPTATSGSTATPPSASSSAATTPAPGSTPSATTPGTGSVSPTVPSGVPVGEFVAGPGLPKPVVKAYKDDKTVVLLIVRHLGIDDDEVRQSVERLRGRNDLAVFVTIAAHVARYSRIAEGVSLNRVPALVVMRPRHLTHGTPTASVSYGFQGADSIEQAVRDALYKGPTNLPYYPR